MTANGKRVSSGFLEELISEALLDLRGAQGALSTGNDSVQLTDADSFDQVVPVGNIQRNPILVHSESSSEGRSAENSRPACKRKAPFAREHEGAAMEIEMPRLSDNLFNMASLPLCHLRSSAAIPEYHRTARGLWEHLHNPGVLDSLEKCVHDSKTCMQNEDPNTSATELSIRQSALWSQLAQVQRLSELPEFQDLSTTDKASLDWINLNYRKAIEDAAHLCK